MGNALATVQRRRGAALEEAILAGAWAELAEVGYTAFSVENVANRARTGKASIYRRWPTRTDLVLDAVEFGLPTPAQCGIVDEWPDHMSTRDALMAVADMINNVLHSPAGDAVRAIKCDAQVDPDLARLIDERFQAPRREAMLQLLRRGVGRGEVRPEAVCPLVADVLPAVLTHRVVMLGSDVSAADLREIMDVVVIPLVEAR